MAVGQAWKANAEDFRGSLWTTAERRGDSSAASDWSMQSLRPAVLPRGQTKRLESRLLIPPSLSHRDQRLAVGGRFEARGQGVIADSGLDPAIVMAPDEYFFVVLTERPEQFSVLQVQDWVRPPLDPEFPTRQTLDYRVVIPAGEGMLPIPDTFFEWTSTAYLLWDDIEPEALTEDQRRAVRDWLHWGGQIIFNGPAAARALAGSEFADLMPIELGGQSERGAQFAQGTRGGLETERLGELLRRWSVPNDPSLVRLLGRLDSDAVRAGVTGRARPGVVELPDSAGLVVEQSVGRGRVAMTRFDLAAGWLPEWASLQSFYNAALLRRPPRQYEQVGKALRLRFTANAGSRADDPRLATRLRIFARDAALPSPPQAAGASESESESGSGSGSGSDQASEPPSPWLDTNVSFTPGTGLGSWTDRSDTGRLASELLREEAGIVIPKSAFVARSLAIYLIVLVPLNYLIFRLLGRLEWAWLAVPLIGLVGAAVIARSAQLDIGFARSRTEIDVLEMHEGYSRGHLSRYVAIYNSLSTSYEFHFANREAVAAPAGIEHATTSGAPFVLQQSFGSGVALTGVAIPSNQTQAVHAEQILELGGSIFFDAASSRLENTSDLDLWDVAVVAKDAQGVLRSDSVGPLASGTSATIRLGDAPPRYSDPLPMGAERMLTRLATGDDLAAGEMRLVGRCEAAQPGLEIQPEVSQSRQQTIVLVHLARPSLPPAEPDRNLRTDFPAATEEHD